MDGTLRGSTDCVNREEVEPLKGILIGFGMLVTKGPPLGVFVFLRQDLYG